MRYLLILGFIISSCFAQEISLPLVKLQSFRGLQLHNTTESKQVNVILTDGNFLSLKLPIFAYVPKETAYLQLSDVVQLKQAAIALDAWNSLPDIERIQPGNIDKVIKALDIVTKLSISFSERLDPFMVPAQKATDCAKNP